ncbi:MAG: GIY-YIG nuclease family protein [Verrucomicrobiales bacterium]|nr:GIY-YIG nuclease family protein [Verrucomicrobiales bacterium]
MTREPGTYALILESTQRADVVVGRLGVLALQSGYYVYVGSAFGPGGLAARVGRHAQPSKREHWHIDHVRARCSFIEVWFTCDRQPLEHHWAAAMARLSGASVPMPGFGSSDCDCPTHLFRFNNRPKIESFRRILGVTPAHSPIGRKASQLRRQHLSAIPGSPSA